VLEPRPSSCFRDFSDRVFSLRPGNPGLPSSYLSLPRSRVTGMHHCAPSFVLVEMGSHKLLAPAGLRLNRDPSGLPLSGSQDYRRAPMCLGNR
jgi:hypothetical protein